MDNNIEDIKNNSQFPEMPLKNRIIICITLLVVLFILQNIFIGFTDNTLFRFFMNFIYVVLNLVPSIFLASFQYQIKNYFKRTRQMQSLLMLIFTVLLLIAILVNRIFAFIVCFLYHVSIAIYTFTYFPFLHKFTSSYFDKINFIKEKKDENDNDKEEDIIEN